MKNTRKAKPYSVKKDDGKTLNCKTTCKDIGKDDFPIVDEKNVFLKKCSKCDSKSQAVCLAMAEEKKAKVVEKSDSEKTGRGFGKYPPFITVWANGEKRGAMKKAVEAMVEKGEYTRAEIITAIREVFPDARPTVPGMYLGHGMKGKGKDAKRFPFKIVADEKGILSYDEKSPKGTWGQE
jgi:hypothetical protein